MTDEPRGARAMAQPLPPAPRLRRALESLGVNARSGQTRNPLGERGDAAQLLGILKGVVEQIETGLRGGELQTHLQKGWFTIYGRDLPAILAGLSEHVGDLRAFAAGGIREITLASRQFATAALALRVAEHALAAAAEVAVGEPGWDLETAEKLSDAMVRAADELTDYVAKLKAEFGTPATDTDA
ncbi:hypothetical protein LI90_4383 (plasmid) [Carbonactinospora thermoautotrophica]|uniref:Uncharacterized protein n=1 Tax=Carbonactinospora thermoautotrophica TaxID=1469144 RepID=A0A132MJ19_9ACTN|nr:hypothetical protein [Carbonactinospora thermoautotrophica]KWW97411.1 hypothetical protein LI90_4383 [Carbonactinospora thermoautotrophica]